jgi:nicotinamide-nucleotide amidase
VISLPGVPREMKDILAASVLPYLRERVGGVGIIKALVLRTAGIGESHIDARITDMMTWTNPTVGLAAHTGQTDIRITARADSETEADHMIAEAENVIRERLGSYIYGTGQELLEDAFMRLLCERKLKLAVSYTGADSPVLAKRLRHEANSEDVIAVELYSEELAPLLERLGISGPEQVDNCELSQLEARRLAAESGADVVIAIVTYESGTGITVVANQEERNRCYRFGGSETDAPIWAGTWGMSMAWHLVRKMGEA